MGAISKLVLVVVMEGIDCSIEKLPDGARAPWISLSCLPGRPGAVPRRPLATVHVLKHFLVIGPSRVSFCSV
jgi:hypothetical protein